MTKEALQDFTYQISKMQLLLTVAIAGALPFLFASLANDHKGLRIYGVITLSPYYASIFFWGLTILTAFSAIVVIVIVSTTFLYPKQVQLHAEYASLPKASIFGGQLHIPYKSIKQILRKQITPSIEMLIIKSSAGEARVTSSSFKGLLGYQDFVAALLAKSNAASN